MTDKLLTTTDVADMLGLHPDTIYGWAHRRSAGLDAPNLHPIKVGRAVRYRRADVEAYLDAQVAS